MEEVKAGGKEAVAAAAEQASAFAKQQKEPIHVSGGGPPADCHVAWRAANDGVCAQARRRHSDIYQC
jgi:hypothetical protein